MKPRNYYVLSVEPTGLDTEAEQDAYMTVRDLLPPVLVSRLAQGNFIAADKVSEAIEYLRTVGAAQLV